MIQIYFGICHHHDNLCLGYFGFHIYANLEVSGSPLNALIYQQGARWFEPMGRLRIKARCAKGSPELRVSFRSESLFTQAGMHLQEKTL